MTWWMAERLAPLCAVRAARVQFPVPARPTISAEKWHFSVTLHQVAHSQALQLSLYRWIKFEVAGGL